MSEARDVPYSLASLDPEDQAILGALTPEGPEPGTPAFTAETEAALEAQAAAAAAADAGAQAQPEVPAQPPAALAPAPAPTEAPAAAPAAPAPSPEPAPQAEHGGDARAALRHARRNEKRLADALREANARIQALEEANRQAGGDQMPDGSGARGLDQMSEDEIADMRENFPTQYAMLQELQALRAKVEQVAPAAPAPAPAEWEPPSFDPRVQEVIDQVPTLLRWQLNQADQPKFNLATTFDTALRADPAWTGRSPAERFAEAVRLTELRLGMPGAPAAAPTPGPTRTDPAAAIAAAPSATPAGISDFRGGGPANPPAIGHEQYRHMTDEQILGSLRPEP